jgi:hypothetical protein
MTERRPDEEVQEDLEEAAENAQTDPVTGREAAEQALIEEGDSEEGADLGDEID